MSQHLKPVRQPGSASDRPVWVCSTSERPRTATAACYLIHSLKCKVVYCASVDVYYVWCRFNSTCCHKFLWDTSGEENNYPQSKSSYKPLPNMIKQGFYSSRVINVFNMGMCVWLGAIYSLWCVIHYSARLFLSAPNWTNSLETTKRSLLILERACG